MKNKIIILLIFSTLFCLPVFEIYAQESGILFTKTLQIGTSGGQVVELQKFLKQFPDIYPEGIITGYFGTLTGNAVKRFQKKEGIAVVGIVGPTTRAKLNELATKKLSIISTIVNTTNAQNPIKTTTVVEKTTTTVVKTTNIATINTGNGSPVRLKIQQLNVDAGFQYNGLKSDGTMEIPNNIVDVGWFTGSVRPGEKGVAIITGHVAQIRGGILTKPGVFYNLNKLLVGDKFYVLNDKGESIGFVVRESRNYDPSADATDVFTSNDDRAHLNLITCEGTWNPNQLSYSQRLVIFADAVQ